MYSGRSHSSDPKSRGSDLNRLESILDSMQQRQDELAAQLDIIKEQNDEILRNLRLRAGAGKQHQVLLPQGKSQSSSHRYFTPCSNWIEATKTGDGDWMLHSHSSHRDETRLLLDWIEYALGGWDFERLSRAQYLKINRLETEKAILPLNLRPFFRIAGGRKLLWETFTS